MDERVPRLRRLPDSEPIGAVDLFTDEELKTSPVYNGGAAQGGTRPAMVRAFADGLGGVLPAAGTAVAPRRPA